MFHRIMHCVKYLGTLLSIFFILCWNCLAISALKVHELVPLLSQVDLSLQHKDGLQVCPGQTRLTYMTSEELKQKPHSTANVCGAH